MKKGLMLVMAFSMISTSAFAYTFKGRVIDAGTKEPIDGAAVVAYWYGEQGYFVGSSVQIKDIKETLTDKNGEWSIEGPEGRESGSGLLLIPILNLTLKPEFIIFKPGYCSWPKGFGVGACKGGLKPSGNHKIRGGETVELPMLTEKGDRKATMPHHIATSASEKKYMEMIKKQRQFIKLINQENRNLGLKEYGFDFLKEDNNDKQ